MRGSTSRFLPGLALVLSLAAPALLAPAAGAAVTVKDPGTYVVDTAGLIDAGTERRVEGWLRELEQKTTAQVKILTVPTTEGEDIVGFAQRHAEAWKLGRKGKDNGALIILTLKERRVRIHTGYGLEGVLPDSWAGTASRRVAADFFSKGKYAEGLLALTVATANRVADTARVKLTGAPDYRIRGGRRARDRHRHRRFADTGAAGAVLPELATPPASSHRLGRPGRGFRPSDGSGSREPPRRRRAFLGRLGRRSRGRLRWRPRRFLRRRRGLWRGRGRSRVVNT